MLDAMLDAGCWTLDSGEGYFRRDCEVCKRDSRSPGANATPPIV